MGARTQRKFSKLAKNEFHAIPNLMPNEGLQGMLYRKMLEMYFVYCIPDFLRLMEFYKQ